MTRAVVVPVSGAPYVTWLSTPPTLAEIQAVVGGWIEALTVGER